MEELVRALGELGLVWPDRVSVQVKLGRQPSVIERQTWQALLRQGYGETALKLGWAIFGRNLELRHLAVLAENSGVWVEAVEKSRALAPLLAPFVLIGRPAVSDIGVLRADLLERGLKPSAWKWLCAQHPHVVRKLLAYGWTEECIFWLNLLSRALPSRQLHSMWLESGRPYESAALCGSLKAAADNTEGAQACLELERLMRLLPCRPDAQTLAQYTCILNAMLLGRQNAKWRLTVQTNSTWKGLLERIRRFDDERIAQAKAVRAAEKEDVAWSPTFTLFESAGIKVVELLSKTDLISEGAALSHCVGDGGYLADCVKGNHVIASMYEPLSRTRATLQLRRKVEGGWYIAQLAGIGNTRVPRVFWNSAQALQEKLAA